MTADEALFMPGDIAVTTVDGGFLISRAVRQAGGSPRWENVEKVCSLRHALQEARGMAIAGQARVWFRLGRYEYEPMSIDDTGRLTA
jgi:hypothetical protein